MDHPKIQVTEDGVLWLGFGDYGREVEVAAISGDGRRMLTVREVGVAEVWQVASGERVARITPTSPLAGTDGASPMGGPFEVFIEAADLNTDGTLALLGLNDGTAQVHRVDGPARVATLHPPGEPPATEWSVVRAARYSLDGRYALVGFAARRVGVWSADGAEAVAFVGASTPTRDFRVTSVGLSLDRQTIFAGGAGQTATTFDVATGEPIMEAVDHAEGIVAVFDDSSGIGWATTSGSVWVARGEGAPVKRLVTGEHWREAVFDAGRVLARGADGAITRWSFDGDRKQFVEPATSRRGSWPSNAVTLALDGERCHYPETGRRVVLRTGDETLRFQRDAQLVRVRLSPAGGLLATDGWKDEVELWDTTTGELKHTLPCPGGSCSVAFSPDGSLVAVGEIGHGGGRYDRHVYVYETATGARRERLSVHDFQVPCVLFSPDGRHLASHSDELVVWDLSAADGAAEEPVLRVPIHRSTAALFYSGDRLVALDRGRVRVFEGSELALSFAAPIGYETPWKVSADGAYLSVGGTQAVFRFELKTGALDRRVVADIRRPEWVPSDALRAEHGLRGGAMLWRTRGGPFLQQGDGPRGWVEPATLSAGGLTAVPSTEGAAILRVTDDAVALVGHVAFEGKLRASRVVDGAVLLVNELGRLFSAPVPDTPAA